MTKTNAPGTCGSVVLGWSAVPPYVLLRLVTTQQDAGRRLEELSFGDKQPLTLKVIGSIDGEPGGADLGLKATGLVVIGRLPDDSSPAPSESRLRPIWRDSGSRVGPPIHVPQAVAAKTLLADLSPQQRTRLARTLLSVGADQLVAHLCVALAADHAPVAEKDKRASCQVFTIPGTGYLVLGNFVSHGEVAWCALQAGAYVSPNILQDAQVRSAKPARRSGTDEHCVLHLAGWARRKIADDGLSSAQVCAVTHSGEFLSWPVTAESGHLDPVGCARRILEFPIDDNFFERALTRHLAPAIRGIWSAHRPKPGKTQTYRFGAPPTDPRQSIVIPVYGRCDFMKVQLALFANDPEMQRSELIFVIDQPELVDAARETAAQAMFTSKLSLTLVAGERNLGFAGATNLGASFATAPTLVLMNSDVFPAQPGWISPLVTLLDRLPNAGIVGCKLLYEDESIQHAGMGFERHRAWDGAWINPHPGKGMPDGVATRIAAIEVPAVTGALMLIRRELYNKLAGFNEMFIIGDYEDSDLCLRVRQQGHKIYCAGDIRMYHLERQTQDNKNWKSWRNRLSRYNNWLQQSYWRSALDDLAAQSPNPEMIWWTVPCNES